MRTEFARLFHFYAKKYPVTVYCLLAFSITWGLKLLYALVRGNGPPVIFNFSLLAQFGPFIAAMTIIAVSDGKDGFMRIWNLLSVRKRHLRWLILAALFEPVIFGGITLFYRLNGGDLLITSKFSTAQAIGSYITIFAWGLFFWGMSEEIGWHGWMLPKLQNRFSPLTAALIMGFITTLWHLNPNSLSNFYAFREGVHIMGYYSVILEQLVISIPITMATTYIFNRSQGNLLVMMVFHSASNTSYFWIKGVFGIVHTDFFRAGFLISFWVVGIIFGILLLRQKEKVTWPEPRP